MFKIIIDFINIYSLITANYDYYYFFLYACDWEEKGSQFYIRFRFNNIKERDKIIIEWTKY